MSAIPPLSGVKLLSPPKADEASRRALSGRRVTALDQDEEPDAAGDEQGDGGVRVMMADTKRPSE